MGVDTKIKILMPSRDVHETINSIKEVIRENLNTYGRITSRVLHTPAKYNKNASDAEKFHTSMDMYESAQINFALDYPCDNYSSGKEQRSIYVYYDHYHGGELINLSMGCWGHSTDIAKILVDKFGGYADFDDCDDISIDYAMPQPKIKEPA